MAKRLKRKQGDKLNLDEFQAYGEYSYAYLSQEKPEEGGAPPASGSDMPPLKPEAVKRIRKRRRTGVFFKLLGVLVALTVLLIVLQETVFRLNAVYVIGNETHTPQQIVATSGLVRGRNIFTIDEAEVARAMEQDHTVVFIGMQIEYPSTVYLYVEERHPVAVMRWLGNQYELDKNGLVMSESGTMLPPDGMPMVTGFRVSNAHVGQQLAVRSAKQVEAYQSIMYELELQQYANQVAEINLSDPDNLYLITAEGITVRMGDAEYMQAKIGAIRTDMAYLRQLGKNSGVLDVSIPEDAKFMPDN